MKRFPWNTWYKRPSLLKWKPNHLVLVVKPGSIKWGIVTGFWYSWKEKKWAIHVKILKQKINSACAHQSSNMNSWGFQCMAKGKQWDFNEWNNNTLVVLASNRESNPFLRHPLFKNITVSSQDEVPLQEKYIFPEEKPCPGSKLLDSYIKDALRTGSFLYGTLKKYERSSWKMSCYFRFIFHYSTFTYLHSVAK